MSNKINRNETGLNQKKAGKKILTGIILAVIALEVILIFYFMFRRMRPAQQETAQADEEQTAQEQKEVTVNWHGKEKTITVDAGAEDYTGAIIDYGEDAWWAEEGFVGSFTMTQDLAEAEGVTDSFSELTVYGNGNVVWITDDAVYSGELFTNRYYGDSAHGYIRTDSDMIPRTFDLDFVKVGEDGIGEYAVEEEPATDYVRISCREQTEPDPLRAICVYLERVGE